MTVYKRQIATALRLIKNKGAKCTWRQLPDADNDAVKPWNSEERSPVDFAVSIAFFPMQSTEFAKAFASFVRGEDIPQGLEIGYMHAVEFSPNVGDTVIRNGQALRVGAVTPLQPDGTPILYIVGLAV